MMGITEKGSIHICIFPMIITALLSVTLITGLYLSHSPYKSKVILISMIILLLWVVFFVIRQKRLMITDRHNGYAVFAHTGFVLLLFVFITIFFILKIWGRGYLSLAPIEKVDNGIAHFDTLYHSAIAESYGRSMFPSNLINGEEWLHYHTFSHLLMYIISSTVSLPVFIAYNYLYPIIFLPIYGFAQVAAIAASKRYFTNSSLLSDVDVMILAFFNIGIFPMSIMRHIFYTSKSHYIISESFLMANTLAFFFYFLIFSILYRKKQNRGLTKLQRRGLLIIIIIPICIFLISWAKISVGLLVTVSIMYYIFRKKMRNWRYWILNLGYGILFLFCMYLFTPMFQSGSGGDKINLLYNGDSVLMHCLLMTVIPVTFIVFELRFQRFRLRNFLDGKTVWIEIVSIICAAAFLPELITTIIAGNYFSLFVEIPALILLCGRGYLEKIYCGRILKKYCLQINFFIAIYCMALVYSNRIAFPIGKQMISNIHRTNLYESAMELRSLVNGYPEKYTIYLDSDSEALREAQESPIEGIYLYPGLTGIGVINASYMDNGKYYLADSSEAKGFGFTFVKHGRLSYDEAVEEARRGGKEYMIYIGEDGYSVIDLR